MDGQTDRQTTHDANSREQYDRLQLNKPELDEAADLRQCSNSVDGHYEQDDATVTAVGSARLKPRNTDVALDGQANRQPD